MKRISVLFVVALTLPAIAAGAARNVSSGLRDVELLLEPNGSTQEALVERLVHLGFEVRVELVRDDGERLSAQITREQAEALELEQGQIIYVSPTRQTVFST